MAREEEGKLKERDVGQAQAEIDAYRTVRKLRHRPRQLAWPQLRPHMDTIMRWANANGSSKYLVAELVKDKLKINVSPHVIYRFVKALNGGVWTHRRAKD